MKKFINTVLCVLTTLTAVAFALPSAFAATPSASTMPSEQDIINVVGILEIMNGDYYGNLNLDNNVTRAEFTKMALCSSTLKNSIKTGSAASPYIDVRSSHWAAGYVVTAVENGFIKGYLDGTFKPDNQVTLEEAATVMLRVLGYSELDSANYPTAQLAKYAELGLGNGISASQGQALTRRECMYLIYNTLCAEAKNGQTYCNTLGYATDTNNRIDYMSLISDNMDGPVTVYDDGAYLNSIGFSLSSATVYRDNVLSSVSEIKPYDVVYYNKKIKTLWCYTEKKIGTVDSINVSGKTSVSSDYKGVSAANDSVIVNGTSYSLGNADVRYKFSAYGAIKCDDFVMLMLDKDGKAGDAVLADENIFNAYVTKTEDKNSITDATLKGPYTVTDVSTLALEIPFDLNTAKIYYGSKNISSSEIEKYDVYYYSVPFNSVWIYREKYVGSVDSANVSGVVSTASDYKGAAAASDCIIVDGKTYVLGNDDVKHKFSAYGTITVDNFVLLMMDKNDMVADAVIATEDIYSKYVKEEDKISVMDSTLKGPYVAIDSDSVAQKVPFDLATASIYYGTKKVSVSDIEKYDVYYYSEPYKSVWLYRDTEIGIVDSVNVSGVTANSSRYNGVSASSGCIIVSGNSYVLGSDSVIYKFSAYGSFSTDDFVMLLLDKNGQVADVVEADNQILEKFLDEDDDRVALINSTLKGPYVVKEGKAFDSVIPFDVDEGDIYHGTKKVSQSYIKTNDVYYYSEPFKSVWIYRDTATGFVNSIAPSRESPTSITVGGKNYSLDGSEIKRQFSNFGTFEEDDFVTLLLGNGGAAVYAQEGDIYDYANNNDDGVSYADLVSASMKGPIIADASGKWTDDLPFDVAQAEIYKKNGKTTVEKVAEYDVIYYSKSLKAVWIYTDKATGTFEAASPDRISPTSVTVSGKTYAIESTTASFALSNLGSFAYGDTVTLLLGKNGGVVEVIAGSDLSETKYGFITEFSDKTYTKSNGTTYTAESVTVLGVDAETYTYEYDKGGFVKGDFVSVGYVDGKVKISKVASGVSASLATNVTNLIASGNIADEATLMDVYITTDSDSLVNKSVTYTKLFASRLSGAKLGANDIYYAKTENGKITSLVLKDFTGDVHTYGVLTSERDGGLVYKMLNGSGNTKITLHTAYGTPSLGAAKFIRRDGKYMVTNLKGVEVTKENFKRGYCVSGGKTYNYASNVEYFIKEGTREYTVATYDDIADGKYEITAYYDDVEANGGRIRVIIAEK